MGGPCVGWAELGQGLIAHGLTFFGPARPIRSSDRNNRLFCYNIFLNNIYANIILLTVYYEKGIIFYRE
jgi:hypothetical protein